ncbi:hypothetical protein ACLMJK_006004 [Lecanora helva]
MDAPSADRVPTEAKSKSQPSCELCQRRKVRCDKGNPCSTCRRTGVKCEVTSRRRLPRGRNGGRRKGDVDLKARIAKLENLVSSLGGESSPGANLPAVGKEPKRDETASKEPSGDMTRFIGSSFWSNLSSEVNGLREILDDSTDSEPETSERSDPANTPPSIASQGFNFILTGPNSFFISPNALDRPPPHMIEAFYHLYFQNVDPIFKVLHAPSMAEHMLRGKTYLDYRPDDPAIDALDFAIYYAGVNTLNDQKCKERFGEEKTDLLQRYRFAFEVYLAKADFLNCTDIAVLQAFVIFLASVRVNDRSRMAWTLLSLAARMSQALGLYTGEDPSSCKPFEIEMRRRLWHQVRVLDINAAADRGTDPMIAGESRGFKIPVNVNDADMFPDMECPAISREGFTDMSFCLMCCEFEPLIRKLVFVPGGETADERLEIEQSWPKKQEIVRSFAQSIQEKYLRHCDMNIPLQWFAHSVGEITRSGMMLYAIRPLKIHPQVKAPRMEYFAVLNIAVDTLAKQITAFQNPKSEPWRWFVWVPWHALAVALAELCSRTEGVEVERAWEVVEVAFQLYAELVADAERGMLWQPINKLMKKARQNRKTTMQMANLSLAERSSSFPNAHTPMPDADPQRKTSMPNPTISDIQSSFSMSGPSDPQLINPASPFGGVPNQVSGNKFSPSWNTGILGPGSTPDPSNASSMQDSVSMGELSAANANSAGSLPPLDQTNLASLSRIEDPNASFLDMAWNNWEDFIGEVNLTDFDMSDPMAPFSS